MKLVMFIPRPETAAAQSTNPDKSFPPEALTLGIPVPGVLLDGEIVDLSPLDYSKVLGIIEGGSRVLREIEERLPDLPRLPLAKATLLAPIQRPPRIFAIGLNYQKHAAESNMQVQKVPTVFMKLPSSVVGPDHPIILPKISQQPDYEAEFAVVIGKPGYQIPAARAMEHVFGYTIVNDVSARDIQLATSQWTLGKSFPTFTPLGPAITTADEVPDPHSLAISLTIDGETLQSSNTSDLIFKIPALIEHLSSLTPLETGDIISTGTPEGVGLGRKPQRWLKHNEEVIVTIEKLGSLRNRTQAE
jgi:2-keto-4-pentenoate hydratase/2-oxohepta-3-ene-1,7-dioic acid hydratase in catechol pathway